MTIDTDRKLVLQRIDDEIQRGIEHGYFDIQIKGERGHNGKCVVTITGGLSHRLAIGLDRLQD